MIIKAVDRFKPKTDSAHCDVLMKAVFALQDLAKYEGNKNRDIRDQRIHMMISDLMDDAIGDSQSRGELL